MVVAQPGRQPVVVQFDIARFMQTSPLITAFSSPLPNNAQLNRALAAYNSDVRRGFVDPAMIAVTSRPTQFGWVSSVNRSSFDVAVQSLGGTNTNTSGGSGGFVGCRLRWHHPRPTGLGDLCRS